MFTNKLTLMGKFNSFCLSLMVCLGMLFSTTIHAQTFVAPFGTQPDPNIVYHAGWYYYTGTSGNGVYLKKAQTLEGLKHTTMTRMFSSANGGPCCDYWAPEMFRLDNKWYIYYTAKYEGEGQRTYVIENTSADPMTGTWVHKGKIYDSQNDLWAIDGTVLETNGQRYFIWSGVAKASDGDKPQRLYIARMTNPWTIQPGRVLLASPLYSWEKDGNVNEGPAIIKNKGRIFLTYSANGCWTSNYLIGTLYMTEGANPLNAASWTKHDQPLFTKFPDRDVYAPGHHSFFKSPDGKEDWFVYHATADASGSCGMDRTTRAQKMYWDANGFPSFGIPDPTGAYLTAPSGEPLLPAGSVLPNGIYKISPTSAPTKALDVSGCSAMRGTNVHQWQSNGLDCQQWHIIATPDGYYSINAVKGGLALDVQDCSSSNGANVRMWTPGGGDCQKWIFEQVSTGVYRIKSKKSGKVLDIQFGGNNDGANLQIYDYLGNAQQHFKLERLDTYSAVAFESHNLAGHYIRSLDGRGRVDKNISPQQDGQWRMVPGLAGKGVSFQSVNAPNNYLRHSNGQVLSQANNGTALFRNDATFYVRAGLADASKVSFESYNYPGNYIRHRNYLLYSEKVSAGTGYSDATFKIGDQEVMPVVSLTAPADNSTFTAPATINMVATASATYGAITKVEFYNGTTLVGTEYVSPYTYAWKNVAAGTYTITAKAIDSKGLITTSASRKITVNNPPNQLPVVSLTAPANNTNYPTAPASISITASATDADGTIAKVEFFNGATKLGEKTAAPYSYTWTNVAVGTYSITAKATDNKGGVTTSAARTVTVGTTPNQLPSVSLTAPANNSAYTSPASIAITATATDADGSIAKVEFFNGSTKLGEKTTAPYSYTWTNVAVGTYSITAKATDNKGGVTTSAARTVTVSAPNQSPAVSLTSPANNSTYTSPASVVITATATDADGTIAKVEFFNGSSKLGEKTAAPYTYTWTSVVAGTYSITAKATDNRGAVTTSSVRSVVVNAPANVCSSIAAYKENGGYVAGSKVKNANNRYECKPFPYSGWCNGAAWAYAPGTGSYWSDAWTLLGSCASRAGEENEMATTSQLTNFPNPFSSVTDIEFHVAEAGEVSISVYDKTGQLVSLVKEGYLSAGDHRFAFDGSSLNAGMYIIQVKTDAGMIRQKMMKLE